MRLQQGVRSAVLLVAMLALFAVPTLVRADTVEDALLLLSAVGWSQPAAAQGQTPSTPPRISPSRPEVQAPVTSGVFLGGVPSGTATNGGLRCIATINPLARRPEAQQPCR